MACFNPEGHGVAIHSPTSGDIWNFGPHVDTMTEDPKGGPCVHVAPVSLVRPGPRSTSEYRYRLIVGDEKTITSRLDQPIKPCASVRGKPTKP